MRAVPKRWQPHEDAELRVLWGMFHTDGLWPFARRAGAVLDRSPGSVRGRLDTLKLHTTASVKLGRKERFPFQHERLRGT